VFYPRDRHNDAFAPDFSENIHRHPAATIVNRHKVMVIDNSLGSTNLSISPLTSCALPPAVLMGNRDEPRAFSSPRLWR
jgi:hypothetical protein